MSCPKEWLGIVFAQIFRQIAPAYKLKKKKQFKLIAPSYIKAENVSLPVDVRHPKTSFLKLHFGNLQIIIIAIIIVGFAALL